MNVYEAIEGVALDRLHERVGPFPFGELGFSCIDTPRSSYAELGWSLRRMFDGILVDRPNDPDFMVGPLDWLASNAAVISKNTVLLTMGEQSNFEPAVYEALNKSRGIIVPSFYGLTTLAGRVNVPIRVCPLGCRLPELNMAVARRTMFTIVAAYSPSSSRKLIPEALSWCHEAFIDQPSAYLYLKVPASLLSFYEALARPLVEDNKCSIHAEWVSDESMDVLYRSSRFGINLSTGEGFSFVTAKFLAAGVPVITPTSGPVGELFDIPGPFRVDSVPRIRSSSACKQYEHYPVKESFLKCVRAALEMSDRELELLSLKSSVHTVERYSEAAFRTRLVEAMRSLKLNV